MLTKFTFAALLIVSFRTALAQQNTWAQCGGNGWTGGTTCVARTTCTYMNDWYSQCIPGASSSAPSSSTPATSTSAAGSTPTPANANYWFSFGDSYTQTGFLNNETLPSPGNPLGNPPYPGYTAVGGVNWIDQATTVSNHSLVLTYNYAYGGATIDASLVAPYEPTVLSLTDQVNEFLAQPDVGTGTKIWNTSNTLFSVWIGINDIGNSYYEPGDRDANVGAHNFLFINVPPVDRSPLVALSSHKHQPYTDRAHQMLAQSTSAQALEKSVIAGFNSKLADRASNLTTAHTGVKTWVWDSNTAFGQVLDDPTAYGFVDSTSYGGTGDFWGNNLHPSSAAQVIWGNNVGDLLQGTVW
ncbi:hypothetical protein EWM64_g783 [Hericium alpestre]|uniref:CBM1 domain-containing protein n=1 Tax=Hericium alpestre TaxID=135208 RepID=A0A4Z0AA65_9AGAM|nr:hypothetical protein EWM64_g783 [Hericium alpestre]